MKIPANKWREFVSLVENTFDVCGPVHESWREFTDIDVGLACDLRDKLTELIEEADPSMAPDPPRDEDGGY